MALTQLSASESGFVAPGTPGSSPMRGGAIMAPEDKNEFCAKKMSFMKLVQRKLDRRIALLNG